MATPYFVADSASVTVLRSLASTAFGKYNLTLPDGVDLEDVYEVSAEGNELAYVASLGARCRVGGMFRRFVRADVNVTAQGEDMVPASDVERVLNDAEKRVSGDFFLESEITKAGLGPWVPFVDFNVGDIANVEIWGRVVPLVVTRIEPKRTEHSDEDWAVHVGGQLLSDAEARLAENADIYSAVVSDRRDLAGLDGKIRTETNNRKAAVAGERSAREAAIEAEASARKLGDEGEARSRRLALEAEERKRAADLKTIRDFLGGSGASDAALLSQLAAVNAQIVGMGGGKAAPAPGLLNSYMSLNTLLWEQQQEINRINERFRLDAQERQRQDAILNARQEEALQRAQTAIDNEEKYRMWPGAGPANREWFSPRNTPFVEVRAEGNTSTARLKRRCTGYIQLMQKMTDGRMDMWGWNVDHPAGTTFELSGGGLLKVEQFFILYQLWEP